MTRRLSAIFAVGGGRPAAALILLGAIVASLLAETQPASPVSSARQALFDGYQQAFPRQPRSQPVTVVAIDERSLNAFGQWPWPRDRLAELVDAIGRQRPAALGLDLYMPEADQTSPERVAARLAPQHAALASALARLPSHDARLARSLRAVPSVLGAAGFDFPAHGTNSGMRTHPLSVSGGDALPYLRNFPYVLASRPELQAAAHGQALLTVSRHDGGVVRRVPLVLAVDAQPVAGLAIEMLRVASGSSAAEVEVGAHGITALRVAELRVPTQRDGEVWLPFAPASAGAARTLSAADVLAGKADADRLAGKLVLVGLTGSGLADQRVTVLGELVAGVEIQAQLLESLFDGRFVVRPWWMMWLEAALMALAGALLIAAMTRRGGALLKLPRAPIAALLGFDAAIVAVGLLVFRAGGLLFDSASIVIGLSGVLISLVVSALIGIDRQTRQLDADRQRLREDAARAAGELAAARRIQLGSLPDAARVFAGETRFALAAFIEPARDVGGDLYDFFMIDARQLCFMVGDVSGKGLPASLFMAIARTLTKSLCRRVGDGLGAVVTLANAELSGENAEALFVTLLIGVLDVDSGELSLVNAGHDGPWRIGADGAVEQLSCPRDAGGPPLCVIDDFVYAAQRLRLAPGDALCLSTDGIGEAFNAQRQVYGQQRLADALKAAAGAAPRDMLRRVSDDVAAFVGTADQSDDMTLLVLRWPGPAQISAD